jgi:branched-chain amino acid transport system permease protein
MTILIIGQLLNGLVSGLLLVLVAMGLTLTLGLLRVLNVAHAAVYTVGAYVGFSTYLFTGNFYTGIFLALLAGSLIGGVLEIFFIRRVYRDPDLSMLLCFGILLGITEIVRRIWGVDPQVVSIPESLSGAVHFGIVPISKYRLFAVGISIAIAIGVWAFLKKTAIGLIVRAIFDNREMVEAFQINTSRVLLLVFAIGSGIAAIGGFIGAPIFGVFPDVGLNMLPLVLAIVLLGGIGSFRGVIISGVLVGIIIAAVTLASSAMSYVTIYVLMVIFLLFRPQGILGGKL